MTPSRPQLAWRRCGECGAVHAAIVCHICKKITPAVPIMLEAVAEPEDTARVVSSLRPSSESVGRAGSASLPGGAPAAGRKQPAAGSFSSPLGRNTA